MIVNWMREPRSPAILCIGSFQIGEKPMKDYVSRSSSKRTKSSTEHCGELRHLQLGHNCIETMMPKNLHT